VLQSAFAVAFRDRCALGALVAFLVTVADIELAGIGAPFWGLLFGVAMTLLLERDDLAPGGSTR
jgi:benzoate membrane transport protein